METGSVYNTSLQVIPSFVPPPVGYLTVLYGTDPLEQCKRIPFYGHANTLFLMGFQLSFPPCTERVSFMSIYIYIIST